MFKSFYFRTKNTHSYKSRNTSRHEHHRAEIREKKSLYPKSNCIITGMNHNKVRACIKIGSDI